MEKINEEKRYLNTIAYVIILYNAGMTYPEIASSLNISLEMVEKIIKNNLPKNYINNKYGDKFKEINKQMDDDQIIKK
jgi:predicted transcriptional regulator